MAARLNTCQKYGESGCRKTSRDHLANPNRGFVAVSTVRGQSPGDRRRGQGQSTYRILTTQARITRQRKSSAISSQPPTGGIQTYASSGSPSRKNRIKNPVDQPRIITQRATANRCGARRSTQGHCVRRPRFAKYRACGGQGEAHSQCRHPARAMKTKSPDPRHLPPGQKHQDTVDNSR